MVDVEAGRTETHTTVREIPGETHKAALDCFADFSGDADAHSRTPLFSSYIVDDALDAHDGQSDKIEQNVD